MLLKDLYSSEFYAEFTAIASTALPNFSDQEFVKRIFTEEFKSMELKQRIRHTAKTLAYFLPTNFQDAAPLLSNLSTSIKQAIGKNQSFQYIFLADYIQEYGVNHFDESMKAIETVTQLSSCEFAIRPFLERYFEETLLQMQQFALHSDVNVRRFASEGCRPRLPWGLGVPALKKHPQKIVPILNSLKYDASEYVRRSVANNLNDISKDHKEYFIQTVTEWQKESEHVVDIVRHASRTLLKQGNKEIGTMFGLKDDVLKLKNWEVLTPEISVGDSMEFSVEIENPLIEDVNARIEYVLYFLLKNGEFGKKVFMISTQTLEAKTTKVISKSHSFKPITTRTYYGGEHKISIQINGVESAQKPFRLKMK
jgi:3-methyladenine DNA glycosylase AlkC